MNMRNNAIGIHYYTLAEFQAWQELNSPDSNPLFETLKNDPKSIFDGLFQHTMETLTDYRKNYPHHQATTKHNRPLPLMLEAMCKKLGDQVEADGDYQKATWAICGMLHSYTGYNIWRDLILPDHSLRGALQDILKSCPLHKRDAQNIWDHEYQINLDTRKFVATEKAQFDIALGQLQDTIHTLSNVENPSPTTSKLLSSAQSVLNTVHEAHEDSMAKFRKKVPNNAGYESFIDSEGNFYFDYPLFSHLINKTEELLKNPENPVLQSEYKKLSGCIQQGRPTHAQKIAGAMLVFLGAALAVAGVALQIFTAGLATPVLCAGFAASALLTGAGIGLFATNRGIAKQTDSLAHTASRIVNSP